jgi:hypothetical protein
MDGSEFGLVGLLFALGSAVGSWKWAYDCKIEWKEGSIVTNALAYSLALATLSQNQMNTCKHSR